MVRNPNLYYNLLQNLKEAVTNQENVSNTRYDENNSEFIHNGLLVKGNYHDIQENNNMGLQMIGALNLMNLDVVTNVENVENTRYDENNSEFIHNGLLVNGNYHDILENNNMGL